MRKGISLNIIGGVTLALIGVAVLLGLFTNTLGGSFSDVFCSSYRGISAIFPGDSPPPKGCGQEGSVEYKEVTIVDNDRFTLRLASAISECWKEYEGYMTDEELCVGWNVKELDGTVDEAAVTTELAENDICPEQIENSDHGCGDTDQITFDTTVEAGKLILIKYKAAGGNERIQVE